MSDATPGRDPNPAATRPRAAGRLTGARSTQLAASEGEFGPDSPSTASREKPPRPSGRRRIATPRRPNGCRDASEICKQGLRFRRVPARPPRCSGPPARRPPPRRRARRARPGGARRRGGGPPASARALPGHLRGRGRGRALADPGRGRRRAQPAGDLPRAWPIASGPIEEISAAGSRLTISAIRVPAQLEAIREILAEAA